MRRPAPLIAWTLCLTGIAAIVAAGILSARYPFTSAQETYDAVGEFFWASSWIGFGVVGAAIVSRRARNPIGWVLVGITTTLGIGILTPAYARAAFAHPEANLPLAGVAGWVGTWMTGLAFGLVVVMLLLFPSGTLRARRRRILGSCLAGVVLANASLEAVRPGPIEGNGPPYNPLGVASLQSVADDAAGALGTAFALLALLAVLDFVGRFRRSRGVQRQQFRWLALTAAGFPLLFLGALTIEHFYLGPDQFDPVIPVFFICGNGLAAAVGVAVTRYRLYEIDRIVSRSLAYILLTGVLVGTYLAAVTLITAVSSPITGDSPAAVAAATLAAAAAFGPARRRIQAGVDRRFNRARYDAGRTVENYRSRLRDEMDVHALADGLVATVRQSMQPAGAVLWLAGEPLRVAEKSSSSTAAVTVPERSGETKGT